MLITKKSLITGKVRTLDIDCTVEQLLEWQGGALIQDVMPHLSLDDREFIISGTVPDEWIEVEQISQEN